MRFYKPQVKSAVIFSGVVNGLIKIVKREGFTALYRGNGAQMVRIFPYAATQFTSNKIYKRVYPTLFGADPSNFAIHFLAGSSAGLSAVILTYPLDAIRYKTICWD